MNETGELAAVIAFLHRFAADQAAGIVAERADYEACWPEHAAAIGREFDLLSGGGGESDPGPGSGYRVGPYEILRELGRGGQATVYLARDPELQREVALKVLPRSFASVAQELRLQREAQTTARLDDSGICPVYAVGQDGEHSYLAMRFVPGETLAARIERARRGEQLPWRTVVELFEQLCLSLQRAHDAGVVHRDIKPGNVMLEQSGRPVLLDFGLAVDAEGGAPLLTRSGDLCGTPAYVPPERLAGTGRTADPRWDLWAVGVCLYEALTLQRPFGAPTLEGLYRAIMAGDLPSARSQVRELPRDLEVVLAVCLETSPERRYQTAADLARDLRAVRLGEPVRARRPGAWRRLTQWHRRHPARATAAWLLLVALGAVIGVQRVMLGEVVAARDEAEALNDFVIERMLLASTPRKAQGKEPTAGEVLDAAAANVDAAFAEPSRVGGTLYHVLGRAQAELGRYPQARRAFERAASIRTETLGSDARETLRSRFELARVLRKTDQISEAEAEIRQVLARQVELFGTDDADSLDARLELARLLIERGLHTEAEVEVREVLAGRERTLAADDLEILQARVELGHALVQQGRRDEAEPIFLANVAERRKRAEADPVALQMALNELGILLHYRASFERQLDKWSEAERVFEEAVGLARRLYESPDPELATALNNVGTFWQDRARVTTDPAQVASFSERAETMLRESLAMREEVDGPDSRRVSVVRNNLGMLLLQQKRHADALAEFEAAVAIRERIDGPDHPLTLGYLQNKAHTLQRCEGPDAAVPVFAEALRRARVRTDRDPRFVAMIEGSWMRCLLASSRSAEGLASAEEVYGHTVEFWGAASREATVLAQRIADALEAAGRGAEREFWDQRVRVSGEGH